MRHPKGCPLDGSYTPAKYQLQILKFEVNLKHKFWMKYKFRTREYMLVGWPKCKSNPQGIHYWVRAFNENNTDLYIDRVSITHGSPRQPVWTLAAAHDEALTPHGHHAEYTACPCLNPAVTFIGVIPSFVGEDYYCETGSRNEAEQHYYFDDPLWDGEGENEC